MVSVVSKLAHWLYAFFTDCLCRTVFFLTFPLSFFPLESKKHRKNPILLVHGYMHQSSVWAYHLYHLRKKGEGPIYTINLGAPFSSLEEFSRKVAEKITCIAEEYPDLPITLIGHSMGGLVCIHAALEKRFSIPVAKVITIGSPLAGTKWAKLAPGTCARQMQIGSKFLQQLRKNLEKPLDFLLFHIGTTNDQVIVPQTSCFLGKEPQKETTLKGIGHMGLLLSKKVHQILLFYMQDL